MKKPILILLTTILTLHTSLLTPHSFSNEDIFDPEIEKQIEEDGKKYRKGKIESIEKKNKLYEYIKIAMDYQKKKENDLAIEQFKKTIEIEANFSYAYTCLGITYEKKGDIKISGEMYKKAIYYGDKILPEKNLKNLREKYPFIVD